MLPLQTETTIEEKTNTCTDRRNLTYHNFFHDWKYIKLLSVPLNSLQYKVINCKQNWLCPRSNRLNNVLFFTVSKVLDSRRLFRAYRLSESDTVRDSIHVRTLTPNSNWLSSCGDRSVLRFPRHLSCTVGEIKDFPPSDDKHKQI